MPRKRLAKRAIKQESSAATVSQLEKNLSTLPAKLTTEINRELSGLRKKEQELKKAVAQTTSQLKATESRIKAAAKTQTATGKKQLAAAKKALQEATKIHRSLMNELNTTTKRVMECVSKLAKLTALRKTLIQFDKDWAKKAKKTTKSVKKTKAKRKKMVRMELVKDTEADQSNIENFDASVENVTLDQTASVAS